MTDKEKIRLQAIKIIDGLNKSCTPNPNGNIMECMAAAEIEALKLIVDYIDSLPKEHISDDLKEAIEQSFIYHENRGDDFRCDDQIETSYRYGFETGANWQKEKMMAKAIDATIEEPEPLLWRVLGELEGLFVAEKNLHDGDGVKVIIVKED